MIPDKIFARVTAGHLFASRTPKKLFGEEFPEYIRKDALLEWAEHMYGIYPADTFKMMIDKLNSL